MGISESKSASDDYKDKVARRLVAQRSTDERNVQIQRAMLYHAIAENTDYTDIVHNLIKLPGFGKYKLCDVAKLMRLNDMEKSGLERMVTALDMFEKYCRHLLKPEETRSPQWNVIKYSNQLYSERVAPINGSRDVMSTIGYSQDIEGGLAFPEGSKPHPPDLVSLVGDFLLAKKEIEAFLKGTHPYAHLISSDWFSEDDCLFGGGPRETVQTESQNNSQNVARMVCESLDLAHEAFLTAHDIAENREEPGIGVPIQPPTPSPCPQGSSEVVVVVCEICGTADGQWLCVVCNNKQLCPDCDAKWHRHHSRADHQRQNLVTRDVTLPNFTSDGIHLSRIKTLNSADDPANAVENSVNSPYSTNDTSSVYSTNKSPYSTNKSPYSTNQSAYSTNQSPYSTNRSANDNDREVLDPTKFFQELKESTMETGNENANNSVILGGSSDVDKRRRDLVENQLIVETLLKELESKMNAIILADEDFHENVEYKDMEKIKVNLLREKNTLETSVAKLVHAAATTAPPTPRNCVDEMPVAGQRAKPQVGSHGYFIPGASVIQYDARSTAGHSDVAPQNRAAVEGGERMNRSDIRGRLVSPVNDRNESANLTQFTNNADGNVIYPHPYGSSNQPTPSDTISPAADRLPGQNAARVSTDVPEIPRQPLPQAGFSPGVEAQGFTRLVNLPIDPRFRVTPFRHDDYTPQKLPVNAQPTLRPVQGILSQPASRQSEAYSRADAPSTPVVETWQCEHCTVINAAPRPICGVCNRTSDNPVIVETPANVTSSSAYHRHHHQKLGENYTTHNSNGLGRDEDNRPPVSVGQMLLLTNEERSVSDTEASRFTNSRRTEGDIGTLSVSDHYGVVQRARPRADDAHMKRLRNDGRIVIHQFKEADSIGYGSEELQLAMENAGHDGLINWLKTRFQPLIQSVIQESSIALSGEAAGDITPTEAREALFKCGGDVTIAKDFCVGNRLSKVKKLSTGYFSAETAGQALTLCEGDLDRATAELCRPITETFVTRIWLPNQALQDSLSSIVEDPAFQTAVLDENVNFERRARMLFAEGKIQSWGRVHTVFQLVNLTKTREGPERPNLHDIVDAVKVKGDKISSLAHLSHNCTTCMGEFPMSQIRLLMYCECKICYECLTMHFTTILREKSVMNLTCPNCSKPDMMSDEDATNYFSFLSSLLQHSFDLNLLNLFETKIRDWQLSKDPDFRWCSNCDNGFIYHGRNPMMCDHCGYQSCMLCNEPWEDQHDGLSCADYASWKADNDPDNQADGLERHLELNGIQCPQCKMKYDLARGGCMHFKCPQCRHEFCSGCNERYLQPGMCRQYTRCAGMGLHCHHPRDCLFYLRDMGIATLQKLLKLYNVEYEFELPAGQVKANGCPVLIQREVSATQKVDEACGSDVHDGNAGLCVSHYKEHLVWLLNKHQADPADIMEVDDLKTVFMRCNMVMPLPTGQSVQYTTSLRELLKRQRPLKRLPTAQVMN